MFDSFEFFQSKVAFVSWLDQVIHLAEQVHEQYWLVVQVFQSVHLFLIEELHFVRSNYLVVVQVYYLEPVLDTPDCCLVFLRQHEPHEVLVIHFVFSRAFEFPGHLVEYAINCLPGQSVSFVPGEVFLVNEEVVISVQFPEPAVKHIEVLI